LSRKGGDPNLLVRKLHPGDNVALDNYLRSDPTANLYPLGWLRRNGITPTVPYLRFFYLGAFRNGELVGTAMAAGRVLVSLATVDIDAASALAEDLYELGEPFRVVVGHSASVTAFRAAIEDAGRVTRLEQDQVLLSVTADRLIRFEANGLRLATPSDLPHLLEATLDMHAHETEQVAPAGEIQNFRRTLEYQIALRKIYVWTEPPGNQLIFKASVSAHCDCGAQIEGVYVSPRLRGNGYGKRGLSQLCQWMLAEAPLASLYVNRSNRPALQLYDSMGFCEEASFKTVFFH